MKSRKIYCNKILIPFLVILFFIIFDMIYFAIAYDSNNIMLLSMINIIINLIFIPLISYIFIRRISRVITIDSKWFTYYSKNDHFKISLISIKDFTYMKSASGFYSLGINEISAYTKEINLTKGVIKKIAKLTNKKLIYLENSNVLSFKEELLEKFKGIKKKIKEDSREIISGLIGLGISIICILLYIFIKNIYLSIGTGVICYLAAVVEMFLVYSDDYITRKSRIIISFVAPIVFAGIFLLVCYLLFNKVFLFVDIIFYSIFLLPAFFIVFWIIILIIAALSYS